MAEVISAKFMVGPDRARLHKTKIAKIMELNEIKDLLTKLITYLKKLDVAYRSDLREYGAAERVLLLESVLLLRRRNLFM